MLVDIAIDQGGCFEGSRPTTHDDPIFPVHERDLLLRREHAGRRPETSTTALTNATLPYVLTLADKGWQRAISATTPRSPGV